MFAAKDKSAQPEFWIAAAQVAKPAKSAFYAKLEETLDSFGFAARVRALCAPAYKAGGAGRPGIDPVVYLKMMMAGFFENLPSERAIAARCDDSIAIREFLHYKRGQTAVLGNYWLKYFTGQAWLMACRAFYGSEYPHALYHVLSRGNRRDDIFRDEADRQEFLKTLAEMCQKTKAEIHAYCLMKNHFHLVIETPEANLVEGMRWLLSTYSNRFNHRHRLCGHVFSGRYKALVIEGDGEGYLRTACDYVHLNPVRAKLLAHERPLRAYAWSSFGLYLLKGKKRPGWLRVDRLLGEHGLFKDTPANRREFERRLETRRREEGDPSQWKGLRRGWCYGTDSFRLNLLERLQGSLGPNHAGEMRREAGWARAEKIIAAQLKRLKWPEATLKGQPKGAAAKMALALRLREETTLSLEEIARRLHMGSRKSFSSRFYQWKRKGAVLELPNTAV